MLKLAFNAIIHGFFFSTVNKFDFSLTCTGINEDECSTCDSNDHRTFSSPKCLCDNKFFDVTGSSVCSSCHYSWLFLKTL